MPAVLITGANRGLGLEFARQYAREGWVVHAGCRSVSPGLQALADDSPTVQLHSLDVTDPSGIHRLAAALEGQPIDVLLNNAGRFGRGGFAGEAVDDQRFGRIDYRDWQLTLEVNLLGPVRMAEQFVRHVARSEQRKIVTLTSLLGSIELNTTGGLYAYRSSKAGVNAVMKSMALDLAGQGIVAVALHPGWVRTDMGGPDAPLEAEPAVTGMREVIAQLTAERAGQVIAYDGQTLPY